MSAKELDDAAVRQTGQYRCPVANWRLAQENSVRFAPAKTNTDRHDCNMWETPYSTIHDAQASDGDRRKSIDLQHLFDKAVGSAPA